MDRIVRSISPASRRSRDDRGLAIVMVSVTMLVLLAFVGLAVDIGMLYNERRQSQASADTAALAAVQDETLNEQVDTIFRIVNATGDYQYSEAEWENPALCPDPNSSNWPTATNATTGVTSKFVPATQTITTDTGRGPINQTNCIATWGLINSEDYRVFVRVPSVDVDATFASMVGMDSFKSSAFAIAGFAKIDNRNRDMLPLAISKAPNGDADAGCLLEPPGGHSALLCLGPDQGAFGTMQLYRPTDNLCGSSDTEAMVRANTAMGMDHDLAKYPAEDPDSGSPDPLSYALGTGPGVILETCPNAPLRPNTIGNDTGNNFAARAIHQGLLMAVGNTTIPDAGGGMLWRYPASPPYTWHTGTMSSVSGIDSMGLWNFIGTVGETFGGDWADHTQINFNNATYDPSNLDPAHPQAFPGANGAAYNWNLGAGDTLPKICDPNLDPYVEDHRNDDVATDPTGLLTPSDDDSSANGQVPGDGILDIQRTWPWNYNRMAHCVYAIDRSGATAVVFDRKEIDPKPADQGGLYDIELAPRFGWVPELWRQKGDLSGGSSNIEIRRFRPVYMSIVVYSQNSNDHCVYRPQEAAHWLSLSGNFSGTSPCLRTFNSTPLSSISGLFFDVEDPSGDPNTMLPGEVYGRAPDEQEDPRPSLIR